jgi:hypothetical protein
MLYFLISTNCKSMALCFNCFFPQVRYSYSLASEQFKSHNLRMNRHHLDSLLYIQVYLGSEFFLSLLESAGPRVPGRYIRDLSVLSVALQAKLVLLLDALLMLFVGTLTYLESQLFLSIVFQSVGKTQLSRSPSGIVEHRDV